jgi:hypothetical protein
VALVDVVADGLAHQVGGDGVGLEAVGLQDVPARLDVAGVFDGLVDFEVVAPAGQFDAVVAEALGLFADFVELQVRPLAGEQGDRTRHVNLSFAVAVKCV